MLTIFIGFGIGILLFWVTFEWLSNERLVALLVVLMISIPIFSIFLGLFSPMQGYKEPVLQKEIEIVSLNNATASQGHGGIFYVSVSGENVYSYRYEVENKYEVTGKSYVVATVSENVTEIESKDCEKPVLKIYKREARKGIWTFSLGESITEYVFYVPEGTIVRNVELN